MVEILIAEKDYKSIKWSENNLGLELIPIGGSRILFGLKVIKRTFFLKSKKTIVVQRYLNDYPSLLKSIALVFFDMVYLSYLAVRNIEIQWICHNINRETQHNHNIVIKLRRYFLLKSASKILVTSKFFIKYAQNQFKKFNGKIEVVSFGMYDSSINIHKLRSQKSNEIDYSQTYFKALTSQDISDIVAYWKNQGWILGYCGGKYVPKKKYLESSPLLTQSARKANRKLKLIYVSDVNPTKQKELYEKLRSDQDIIFVNTVTSLDLHLISKKIDFHFTGYNDVSMPYSVHVASSLNTPILCLNLGVLPEVILHYNIGVCIDTDMSDFQEKIDLITQNSFSFENFNQEHSWDSFAKLFLREIKLRNKVTQLKTRETTK